MFHVNRDASIFCILKKFFTRNEIPFAPRSDHFDTRFERVIAELKAYLVVALTRCAVGHGVSANFARDFDLTFRNERACNRGAQQVFTLVHGIATKHWEDEVAHKLFTQVVNEDLFRFDAKLDGFGACRFEFFALADIGCKGHDLTLIGVLQPFEND